VLSQCVTFVSGGPSVLPELCGLCFSATPVRILCGGRWVDDVRSPSAGAAGKSSTDFSAALGNFLDPNLSFRLIPQRWFHWPKIIFQISSWSHMKLETCQHRSDWSIFSFSWRSELVDFSLLAAEVIFRIRFFRADFRKSARKNIPALPNPQVVCLSSAVVHF